jgi:hypothetical protein
LDGSVDWTGLAHRQTTSNVQIAQRGTGVANRSETVTETETITGYSRSQTASYESASSVSESTTAEDSARGSEGSETCNSS